MNTNRAYQTGRRRIVAGIGSLTTLGTHLDNLGIRNPEWIIRPSMKSHVAALVKQGTGEDIDAMVVFGCTEELRVAHDMLTNHSLDLPLILIPSGQISPSQLIEAPYEVSLMLIDESLAGRMRETEIKQLMSLSLFYLLASLTEPYDPMITVDARFILTRAIRVQKELTDSRKLASYLTTTILPVTIDMGRNRRANPIISLMNHLTVYPFTIFDSAGMLLLPLVRYIREEYSDIYTRITHYLSEPDIESWVIFWKEGISFQEKETTLRLLTGNLEQILCEGRIDKQLSAFFRYLSEEDR
ncbi:MAG: hypothetical protein JXK93_02365 [Sphaerochaetaceae bacterium]|nr:hypothetical protein [Sphaerochaetaceae bacterium]